MKKLFFPLILLVFITELAGQTTAQQLQKAYSLFEKDEQLKHALSSLYVIDAKTGVVIFDKNAQLGLAPASTQKIITSVTAFELLGKEYRYQTKFGYQGKISGKRLYGRIFILPGADPTLGTWRYESTRESKVLAGLLGSIKKLNIDTADYLLYIDDSRFADSRIPDGWIWQDIGNYYGAGAGALNWRENQYDLVLSSGSRIGDPVDIKQIKPYIYEDHEMISELKSASKGSGDNAYIYLPLGHQPSVVRGTIPVNENSFTISGAWVDPAEEFRQRVLDTLQKTGLIALFDVKNINQGGQEFVPITKDNAVLFHTVFSPTLDSLIYWFNKKSINLYGEALLKTFSLEQKGIGSTDSGVAIVKKFWKGKGIDEDELNIYDGSGLSPLNRVTTHAQVEILKYAKTKDWFPYFLQALPEYNGMTMKSGTISDVKGFCGYHKSKDGKEYIFSFLVNNYSGKTSPLVQKMFKVLDDLK